MLIQMYKKVCNRKCLNWIFFSIFDSSSFLNIKYILNVLRFFLQKNDITRINRSNIKIKYRVIKRYLFTLYFNLQNFNISFKFYKLVILY
jgi:hypothetical protein